MMRQKVTTLIHSAPKLIVRSYAALGEAQELWRR